VRIHRCGRRNPHRQNRAFSAITDEIACPPTKPSRSRTIRAPVVEIRNPPGSRKGYFALTEPEIKADAVRFRNEGSRSVRQHQPAEIRLAGERAGAPKTGEPGRARKAPASEKALWDRRMEDLRKALRCAQIMGADKVRVFHGIARRRPGTMFPRIADVLGEMALAAEKEKIYLLIETKARKTGHFRGTLRHHQVIGSKRVG